MTLKQATAFYRLHLSDLKPDDFKGVRGQNKIIVALDKYLRENLKKMVRNN